MSEARPPSSQQHVCSASADMRMTTLVLTQVRDHRLPCEVLMAACLRLTRPSCCTTGVRKTSLMVLTHLIMNDMMKVKGHISKMALCLVDEEPRIKAMAELFFHELAQKAYKVVHVS